MPQLRNLLSYLPVDGYLHQRWYYYSSVHLRDGTMWCPWGTLFFRTFYVYTIVDTLIDGW